MTLVENFSSLVTIAASGIVLSCLAIYFILKKQYGYWKRMGVANPEPTILFGNMTDLLMLKTTETEMMDSLYREYAPAKYIGIYSLWKPVLLVRDLEMAKKILETDFDHFMDRPDVRGHSQSDAILESIFCQTGRKWKIRRQVLNRLFTPRKLKDYLEDVHPILEVTVKEIDSLMEKNSNVEFDKIMDNFTVRVICKAMYGLDIIDDKERTKTLTHLADLLSHPPIQTVLNFLFYSVAPTTFGHLGIRIYPVEIWKYFTKFVDELIHTREEIKVERNDLLELVIKLKKEGATEFDKISKEEVVGHLHSFFIAGHHTIQLTVCHVLVQLSLHPEVQDKLRKEVESVMKGSRKMTYEHINQMTYMDNVIAETMRIYTLIGVLKRVCTKPYKLDNGFTVPKGMDVLIPSQSFQMEPALFPHPERFIPERFAEMDGAPAAFMPFGKGPRICIGMRFADVIIKLTIGTIISKYTVMKSEKMFLPMKFDPRTVLVTNRPLGGMWVKLAKRSNPATTEDEAIS